MVAFRALALVLLAGTACSASPSRIVGGEPTTVERYPSLVQVDYLDIFSDADVWIQSCAANVLTSRHVLTAAHCFFGWSYAAHWRRIRAGSTFSGTGGTIHYIVREYNHPSYGYSTMDGDISVVLLQTPLIFSPVVQQGSIVNQGFVVPDNLPVVFAGWGALSHGGPDSDKLLNVTVYTVNNSVCAERYLQAPWPFHVTENMICAGILDVGGKGACQGDSGGPLYYNDIIIGIISWGVGCADAFYPSVSTKVSAYTNWIVDTVVAS